MDASSCFVRAGPVLLIDAPRDSNLTGSYFSSNELQRNEGCFET